MRSLDTVEKKHGWEGLSRSKVKEDSFDGEMWKTSQNRMVRMSDMSLQHLKSSFRCLIRSQGKKEALQSRVGRALLYHIKKAEEWERDS